MSRTVIGYLPSGYLNSAASASPTGSTDAESGLPIQTGLELGQFQEFGDADAARYSNPALVGITLYSGQIAWVQLDPAVTGNAIPIGTALWWLQTSDNATGNPVVTTVSGSNAPDFAGVSIDSNFGPKLPYAFIQQDGKTNVLFDKTLTVTPTVFGDLLALKSTQAGTFDDLGSFTSATAFTVANAINQQGIVLGAYIGGQVGLARITRKITRY